MLLEAASDGVAVLIAQLRHQISSEQRSLDRL